MNVNWLSTHPDEYYLQHYLIILFIDIPDNAWLICQDAMFYTNF